MVAVAGQIDHQSGSIWTFPDAGADRQICPIWQWGAGLSISAVTHHTGLSVRICSPVISVFSLLIFSVLLSISSGFNNDLDVTLQETREGELQRSERMEMCIQCVRVFVSFRETLVVLELIFSIILNRELKETDRHRWTSSPRCLSLHP